MAKSLKEQREKLGRELNEIAKITRIKKSYLKAIEEEDFAKLPVEVYTKGYIREYAKFLGFPPDAAVAPYEAYLEELRGEKEKGQEQNPPPEKSIENDLSTEVSPKIDYQSYSEEPPEQPIENDSFYSKGFSQKILWAISLVAAVVVIYLLIPHGENVTPVQRVKQGVQYRTPEIVPSIQADVSQEKGVQSTPTGITDQHLAGNNKAEDKNKTAQKKKHNLDITATDKTWIQIVIDGDDKKEVLLNPGEKVNYEAVQSINVLIGNAAGVKLKFNGKEFENLGDKGHVVTLSFPFTIPKKKDSDEKIIKPESPTPQPSNSSNL